MTDKQTRRIGPEKNAIILGNGPSLTGFDFSRLAPFDVFGMNAAYRYWDEINWYPQFYACLDLVVGLSHAQEIKRLIETSDQNGIRLFLLRENLVKEIGACRNQNKIINFDMVRRTASLLGSDPITTGSHSAAWAAMLGYRSIYLLGIDCNYEEIVPGARNAEGYELEIVEEQSNPNYFFDGYQRKGDKFNIPNPQKDLHLRSWRQVGRVLDHGSVRVLNANAVSKVDAFEFCTFEDALEDLKPVTQSPETHATQHKDSLLSRATRLATKFTSYSMQLIRKRPLVLGGAFGLGCIAPALLALMNWGGSFSWILFAITALNLAVLLNALTFLFARSYYRSNRIEG